MPIVKGFRRFQSNNVSFRQVVSEISSSNVQQSGWCSASATSKSKRISIADRRALLESFVNKYRAMNSGKFPTPTSAQKEVGGGYYSIRKMLQEMEYNSKLSSHSLPVTKEIKKQNKSEDAVKSSRSQQVPNSKISMDQNLYEEIESLDKNCKGKEPSTSSNNITTRDDTHNSIATKSEEELENDAKDEGATKAEQQQQQHDVNGIRNINMARETSESQKDEELREKELSSSASASIWGNLKSLASGFINIWKKQ